MKSNFFRKKFVDVTFNPIKMAIDKQGIDCVRRIVYGDSLQYEYIAMMKYIESRAQFVQQDIFKKLTGE
jgi:hypothetical protein